MTSRPVRPRLAPLPREAWSEEVRTMIELTPGGATEPLNIFTTLVRHPTLVRRWLPFGTLLLTGELPPRDRAGRPRGGLSAASGPREAPAAAPAGRDKPAKSRARAAARGSTGRPAVPAAAGTATARAAPPVPTRSQMPAASAPSWRRAARS